MSPSHQGYRCCWFRHQLRWFSWYLRWWSIIDHLRSSTPQAHVSRDQLYIQSKAALFPAPTFQTHILAAGWRVSTLRCWLSDTFLLHRPTPQPEEVAAAFDKLQTSGKVRHFGVLTSIPCKLTCFKRHQTNGSSSTNSTWYHACGAIDFGLHEHAGRT